MEITSSIFSFVDFNPAPVACNDAVMGLPAVTDFGIKFQFRITDMPADILPWAAPVFNGAPVLSARKLTDSLCGRLTIPIPFSAYPVTIVSTGTLPDFDDDTYDTPEDLLANLVSKNEFDWVIDDTHIYADSCCIPPFVGVIDVTGADSYTLHSTFMLDYIFFWADIPAITMEGIVAVGECFNYGVYEFDPSFDPDSLIELSTSTFKRMEPSCFFSKVLYWSDKDAFDFSYTCGKQNSAWLPLYMTNPTNPTTESVYVESTGNRRVLSASIDEEYVMKTDRLTQWLHRKIEGMLLHDHKVFTNTYFGLVAEALTKSGPYDKEWDDTVFVPTATAKTKLIKNISYFNSGCCTPELDCCEPEAIACGQISALAMATARDGSDWEVAISACTYVIPPTVSQTVEIFWRERYSVGAFTSAGTVVFDIGGDLTSTPDPFQISGIPDDFQEIEIKAVNGCGSDDFITTINNPCETMTGITADAVDNGDATWTVEVTNVVYSNWPAFGVHKALYVEWREYPGGGIWQLGENLGNLDLVVAPGYVVTLNPTPYHIGPVADTVERIEVRVSYGCSKQLLQLFSTPLAACVMVSEVQILDITDTTADATWPATTPPPTGLYDWELWDFAMTTLIDSGTGYWNPGTLVLGLNTLTPDTHYNFRVRANCDGDGYSSWAEKDFTTLP